MTNQLGTLQPFPAQRRVPPRHPSWKQRSNSATADPRKTAETWPGLAQTWELSCGAKCKQLLTLLAGGEVGAGGKRHGKLNTFQTWSGPALPSPPCSAFIQLRPDTQTDDISAPLRQTFYCLKQPFLSGAELNKRAKNTDWTSKMNEV